MTRDAAKNAYDKIDKQGAFYIDWFVDDVMKALTSDLHTATALEPFLEVYVVGRNFEWTSIKTHENICRPYFLELR